MFKYIVKRLLISIVVLLGVSIIIYSLVRMMPNNYLDLKFASKIQSGDMTLEQLEAFKVQYGISDNSFTGIVTGYFKWLGNMLKGDLGTSFKYELPVAEVISSNMWVSFAIAVIATILQFAIAIPLGITSATHQYSKRDYAVTVFTMIGIALPTYFFAAIIVKVFSVQLGWFPSSGLISAGAVYTDDFAGFMAKLLDMAHHLVLPIACTVILSLGGLMRYTRTNTLEVLNADYIRTARAKGLSEKKVIYHHAFRNTLIPTVTILGGSLPALFSGALITETLFGIPGIGYASYYSMTAGDIPFSMFYLVFMAMMTLLGNLITDVLYAVVDPRVRVS